MMRSLALHASGLLPQPLKHWLGTRLPVILRVYAAMLRSEGEVFVTPAGPAAGIRWRISPQCHRLALLGTSAPEVQRVLVENIQSGWVVYDLGANIGFYTLLMAKLVGAAGRVVAFEPAPAMLAELKCQVALNGFEQIQVLPYAVAAADTQVTFELGASPLMSRIVGSPGRAVAISVQARTLDRLVYVDGLPAPQLIKMNVEGSEVDVVAGGSRLFRERRPILVCEVHSPQLLERMKQALGPRWHVSRLTEPKPIAYHHFQPS